MKRYTLIIADSSEDFCSALRGRLDPICNVFCCKTGKDVLQLLQQHPADVLVLDLMLPQLDGLSLLQALSAAGDCPGILASSCYVSPFILDTAEELNVSFLLEKPCSLCAAEECIRELIKRRDRSCARDRFMRISGLLLRLGFSAKLRGYAYLRDAALRYAENPGLSIMKELYPSVAGAYGVSPEDVEHSIRSAAMDAWGHRIRETWALYFPQGDPNSRPSNACLIQGLASELPRLQEEEAAEMIK